MIERYIKNYHKIGPFNEILDNDFIKKLKQEFPPLLARRMTLLSLLIGNVCKNFKLAEEDEIVYATTCAEGLSLESFLLSFPTPSPLHFQNSIHPSGIEQVLIARQQPINNLLPINGAPQTIILNALMAIMHTQSEYSYLISGEEKGNRLSDVQITNNCSYAYSIEFCKDNTDAIGKLCWKPCSTDSLDTVITGDDFIKFLDCKKELELQHKNFGKFKITWH